MLKYAVLCVLLALAAARPQDPVPELVPEPIAEQEPMVVDDDGDLESEATLFHKSISLGYGSPVGYYGAGYPYAYRQYPAHNTYYQPAFRPAYGFNYHKVLPGFSIHKQIF